MDLMLLKKFSILFLLVSGSLLSTSLAGRPFAMKLAGVEAAIFQEEAKSMKPSDEEEAPIFHERLLRMNAKDCGRYNPTPALAKPHFKLIPN